MRMTPTLTAIGLVMSLAVPAIAQQAVANLDKDQNEQITVEEWTAYEGTFTEANSNQDNHISQDEFKQWAQTTWGGTPGGGDDDGPLFGLLDINDDQQITQDEWFTQGQFDVLDDNDSAYLEDGEFMAPGEQEQQTATGVATGGAVTQDEWASYRNEWSDVDADGSGQIDEEEFNQWATANWGGTPGGGDDDGPLFGLFDVNDDVQVTEDEWFSEDAYAGLDDDESGVLEDAELGL